MINNKINISLNKMKMMMILGMKIIEEFIINNMMVIKVILLIEMLVMEKIKIGLL
jgi:hypothetical protein